MNKAKQHEQLKMKKKKEQIVYFVLQGKHSYDNIFVTKNVFSRNEHQKNFLTRKFLVDPVGWRQTNIFLSLTLFYSKHF